MTTRRLIAVALAMCATISASDSVRSVAAEMAQGVELFLTSQASEQESRATFAFRDDERFNWHFIPRARKGVPLEDLTPAQRKLAHALLGTALSTDGLRKAERIMFLEQILFDLDMGRPLRNPDAYFYSVFGQPGSANPWGWRFEGHHLSLNFTLKDGQVASTSPAFFGANPAKVESGPLKGLQVLKEEEELGRELIRSLPDALRQRAVISEEAPSDIVTAASRTAQIDSPKGASAAEMSTAAADLLGRLVAVYTGRFRPELASQNFKLFSTADRSSVYFAWAGSTEVGKPHYYRIQGPSFLIEYDNAQNGANHVHTVYRDLHNDFGRDLLKEHYEHSH